MRIFTPIHAISNLTRKITARGTPISRSVSGDSSTRFCSVRIIARIVSIYIRWRSRSSRAPAPMEKTLPGREQNFVCEQTDNDDDEHDADNLVHGI